MRRFFKWLLYLGGGAIICGLTILSIVGLVFWNTVPANNGRAKVAGLLSRVDTVIDKHGVPHISASSQKDAIRMMGYLHARERLWQMETLRRAGNGRLSELFGEKTVDTDIFLRTLDLAGSAQASINALQPETKEMLQIYADGVNAWVQRETSLLEPTLPPEFLIFGVDFEPWEASDPLMMIKLMALTLGQNHGKEINRLALASYGLSAREIDEVFPYGPRDKPADLPDLREIYGFGPNGKMRSDDKKASITPNKHADLAWPIGVRASNNWVVHGDRTESGKPILANDPHLGLTAPALFYQIHLSYENDGEIQNIIGGSMPGTPAVLVGRNDRVAWGLTTTGLDNQDLFLEREVVNEPDKYHTPEGIETFETREVVIKVAGEDDVTHTIKSSKNGPLLPLSYKNIEEYLPERHQLALSWIALAKDDTTFDSAFKLATAKTVQDAIEGLSSYVAPMQSLVLADVDGNIGMIAPGRIPIRDATNKISGRAPVPGWLPQYQWKGMLSAKQAPTFLNSDQGAFATANANFLAGKYEGHITFDWAEHFRQARAEKLVIERQDKETVESSIATQGDLHSDALTLLRDLTIREIPAGLDIDTEIVSALQSWDGQMLGERPEPLIMTALYRHLHKAVFEDDFPLAYSTINSSTRIGGLLRALRQGTVRNWCDNISSSAIETCAQTIVSSTKSALAELTEKYGSDWRGWRWQNAHLAINEHRPFGQVGALKRFFNVEVKSSGGPFALRRGQTKFAKEDNPYASRHGSAYRGIYDFNDLNNSKYVIATGQSGNFLSPFYADQSKLWAEMKYLQMSTDPKDFKTKEAGVWSFEPAQ